MKNIQMQIECICVGTCDVPMMKPLASMTSCMRLAPSHTKVLYITGLQHQPSFEAFTSLELLDVTVEDVLIQQQQA